VRHRLYTVVFESDTPAGRAFDVVLIATILLSVVAVTLDSVPSIAREYGRALMVAEWAFTALFTLEYALRLAVAPHPLRYAVSFFGVIDLLAILPTYISIVVPASRYLLVIRVLRVLRVFRVLKLTEYTGEAQVIMRALRASRRKITVFVVTVLTLVTVIGALMYLVEGPQRGLTSIPVSIYWAVVTLSTVGYGDIAPATPLGQALASLVMILGYGIIAVPTGIVTVELTNATRRQRAAVCRVCGADDHGVDAAYCRICGSALPGPAAEQQRTTR
jgi:voltage-gated potassium channel